MPTLRIAFALVCCLCFAPLARAQISDPRWTFIRHSGGWSLTLTLPPDVTGATLTAPGLPDEPVVLQPAIPGQPFVMGSVQFPAEVMAGELALAMTGPAGARRATYAFDARRELEAAHTQILQQIWTSWVAFGDAPTGPLLYYTTLVSYRCAIREAWVGFGPGEPDRAIALPPCDLRQPSAIPERTNPWLRLDPGVREASLRLVFANGATSPVRRFRKP